MNREIPLLSVNAATTQDVLDWVLPAVGILITLIVLWYVWRYLKNSNRAGRVSDFDERTFKKLVEVDLSEDSQQICSECKIPMRLEIRYKDYMKDTGDFLLNRDTAIHSLKSLVEGERISQVDYDAILVFFNDHPDVQEQLFKRFKCPNCDKTVVLPYEN
ncbi:MAG: hypothetical protein ACTSO7_08295 [Candidatus Heimdallarchaeota archaeon]